MDEGERGGRGGGEGFRSTLHPSFFSSREAPGCLARMGKRANSKAASASYGRVVRTADAIPIAVLHVTTSAGEVEFRKKARRCEDKFGDMCLAAPETKVNDRQTLKDALIERIREEDKDRRPGSKNYITKKQLIWVRGLPRYIALRRAQDDGNPHLDIASL